MGMGMAITCTAWTLTLRVLNRSLRVAVIPPMVSWLDKTYVEHIQRGHCDALVRHPFVACGEDFPPRLAFRCALDES